MKGKIFFLKHPTKTGVQLGISEGVKIFQSGVVKQPLPFLIGEGVPFVDFEN